MSCCNLASNCPHATHQKKASIRLVLCRMLHGSNFGFSSDAFGMAATAVRLTMKSRAGVRLAHCEKIGAVKSQKVQSVGRVYT